MIETIEQVACTVWNELGYGYREDVYEKAMAHEMRTTHQNMVFNVEAYVEILYKGAAVGLQRLDFIIDEELAVELKTGAKIAPTHRAQTEAYLRTTRLEKGLIVCFTPTGVECEPITSS